MEAYEYLEKIRAAAPRVHLSLIHIYWVMEYRVDGFRFDLASILTRDQNGAPMPDPPILQGIACDPI